MALAAFVLRPPMPTDARYSLQLASETNALRQPRVFNFAGIFSMDPKTIEAAPIAGELAQVDSESPPIPIEGPVAHGAWTRDIEALCRALAAQQRAHFPTTGTKDK